MRRTDPVALLVPLAAVLMWEGATRLELLDPRFFIPLTEIAMTAWQMIGDGTLWPDLIDTLRRLALAFVFGAATGSIVGMAAGVWKPAALVIQPLVYAIYPLPKIALLPLLIIIVGLGETAFILTAFATAVFQVVLSVSAGVRGVDGTLIEAGRNYGAHGWRFLVRVLLPGMLPVFLNALRLAMGLTLITVIAVEFIGARSGIGHMIHLSWQQLQVAQMYVGILVAGLLGHAISLVFRALERKLMPWRHTGDHPQTARA